MSDVWWRGEEVVSRARGEATRVSPALHCLLLLLPQAHGEYATVVGSRAWLWGRFSLVIARHLHDAIREGLRDGRTARSCAGPTRLHPNAYTPSVGTVVRLAGLVGAPYRAGNAAP